MLKRSRFLHKFQQKYEKVDKNLRRFWVSSGAKVWESCRSRKTLQNEYLDAKIGVDTAENEPSKLKSLMIWLKNLRKVRYRTFQLRTEWTPQDERFQKSVRAPSSSLPQRQPPTNTCNGEKTAGAEDSGIVVKGSSRMYQSIHARWLKTSEGS